MDRFLVFIGFAFITVLLSVFILTYFNLVDYRLLTTAQVPGVLQILICIVLAMGNMFFVFSISMQVFDKSIIKMLLKFLPICLSLMLLPASVGEKYNVLLTGIVPLLFCLRVNKKLKSYKILIYYSSLSILVGIFQQITGYIKLDIFGTSYFTFNIVLSAIFQIDLFLLYILIYKVVKRYVRLAIKQESFFKLAFSSKDKCFSLDKKNIFKELHLDELNKFQLFIFWCIVEGYELFQLLVVLLIGFLNNTFAELVIMLAIFLLGKPMLKKCWHGDTLLKCSAVTFVGFYILTKITLPLSISLFSCITLSAIFVYCLFKVGDNNNAHRALL